MLEEMKPVLTVTQLNEYIKGVFESAPLLSSVCIKGEISNFTHHKSGHLYFSLKDEGSVIRAVMFRGAASKLQFMPESGMKVIAKGSVSLFVRDGSYQIYVTALEPDGIGALYLAFEQLKRKLEAEGLFAASCKKPLPRFPMRIGVITSPTGAAVRDIINVLGRRFPIAEVRLFPALVQGDGAAESLIKGLEFFNSHQLADVVIIGRGGGSIEDLWAFNNERLARAVVASRIPVISAVGHETDFTICDFVADRRAPTPSAAAEIAVPDAGELRGKIENVTKHMALLLHRHRDRLRKNLELLAQRRVLNSADSLVRERHLILDAATDRLCGAMGRRFTLERFDLGQKAAKLEAMSPLSILARGYGVVTDSKKHVLHSVEDLKVGDAVSVRLADGTAVSEVKRIEKE